MAIFWPKTMGQPLWKNVNFGTFWTCYFYALHRCFFVPEYRQRHFLGLYCLKKKVGEMAIFGPKPWVIPFAKMSIFEVLVFIVRKPFFILEYCKRHFLGLYCLKKKKLQKWPFWDLNHGLTSFEKCQIWDFLNLLFLCTRKAFFHSRILKRYFLGLYWLKKKS